MGDKAVGGPDEPPVEDRDLLHLDLSGSHSRRFIEAETLDITRTMVLAGIWGVVDSPGVAHCPRDTAEPPIFQMRE